MKNEVYVEEGLLEVFSETDLTKFQAKLCVDLQLCRLEHFDHVTDDELHLAGLSIPSIRRLRQAIVEKKKRAKKSKGLFSTVGKKEGQNMTKLVLATDVIPAALPTTSKDASNTATCLIAKEEIFLAERLGEGSFAVVKRATWKRADGIKLDVAVKILRDPSTEVMEDLQQEVNNMQRLQHPNLIRLFGIVFASPAMMVVEFCDGGALIDRLRSVEKPVLLVSTLLDYSLQIAKGMTYLESKNCVHRDLAARNVLLTDSERTVKICDFGLMRVLNENERLYTMSAQKKIPFAWCPPESLRHRQFSRATDVWAFGVTLWELFSYGEEPWAGLRGADVLAKIEAGERLQRPQRCSSELFDLITTCWSGKVDLRPRFSLLKGILADVKFTIAECRENCMPDGDLDLELRANDRVIVIEGSGVIWYGQNIRTRNFGRFRRSAIHVRNERNGIPLSDGNLNAEQTVVKETKIEGSGRISKPIPGSFIHAGHGDINPTQCWGQPERIDDIYLKNPILRKEREMKNNESGRPQFIPSVVSMQTPPTSLPSKVASRIPIEKPLQSNKSSDGSSKKQLSNNQAVYSSSAVDPFAPFSEYYYDAFDENSFDTLWEPVQQSHDYNVASSSASPSSLIAYDTPPLEPTRLYEATYVAGTYDQFAQPVASLPSENGTKPKPPIPPPPILHEHSLKRPDSSTTVSEISSKRNLVSNAPALPDSRSEISLVPGSSSPTAKTGVTYGHPFQLPPPTSVTRPLKEDSNTTKIKNYVAVPRPVRSSPDPQITSSVEKIGTSTFISEKAGSLAIVPSLGSGAPMTDNVHTAPALSLTTPLGGFSKAPASLSNLSSTSTSQLVKSSSAVKVEAQKTRSASTPKLAEISAPKAPNFNGPGYFAASAREVRGERIPANRGRNSVVDSKFAAKKDIVTSVLRSSRDTNSSATFKARFPETTFAVNLPSSSKIEENRDLIQKSATVSARVTLAAKNSSTLSTSGNNVRHTASAVSAPVLSTLSTEGPDPFEVSSSVKNIASRGRYSEVFVENRPPTQQSQTSAGRSSSSQTRVLGSSNNELPRFSTSNFRDSVSVSASSSSWLPPPSSLLFDNDTSLALRQQPPSSSSAPESSSSGLFNGLEVSQVAQPHDQSAVVMRPQNGLSRSTVPSGLGTTCNYSASTATVLGQKIPNQVIYGLQPRELTHRDSTPILGGYGTMSGIYPDNRASSFLTASYQPPYYWQPGQSAFPSTLTPQSSTSLGVRGGTALVYDANLSNSPRTLQPVHTFTGISLSNSQNAAGDSRNRVSNTVSEEILGLFDPLTSSISNSSGSANAENRAVQTDPVDAVLKEAIFAGREKCATMLRKCNNDIMKAVQELKAEEILAMGLTHDRSVAITALEDCRWDLNAAAAALIT